MRPVEQALIARTTLPLRISTPPGNGPDAGHEHRVGERPSCAGGSGRLLLASDGLFRYAPAARIEEVTRVGTAQEAAEALLALVRLPSGGLQDDLGLAVLDIA